MIFEIAGDGVDQNRVSAPDFTEAWYHWGACLKNYKNGKADAEAADKFSRTVGLKPDCVRAWCNWGIVLRRMEDFKASREKFQKAEALKPGGAAYNLACLGALTGDRREGRTSLEFCRELKIRGNLEALPDCGLLSTDPDLDPVRGEKWLQQFMEDVCPSGASDPPTA